MQTPQSALLLHGTNRLGFENEIRPHFSAVDFARIMSAYRLSKYGHRNQIRDTGERYFEHPKILALLLVRLGVYDADIIIAALLHDVIEDSYILEEQDVTNWFGARCCNFIMKVTKLKKADGSFDLVAYFATMLADEVGTWLVKLADRLHNLSTLPDGDDPVSKLKCRQKKDKQVAETIQFILPLATALANTQGFEALGKWFYAELSAWCQYHSQPQN